MPTTTPAAITSEIRDLCSLIVPNAEPVYVPVKPAREAVPQECFWNVRKVVGRAGGKIAYGWSLWIWPEVFAEAEHHAVWEMPKGPLLDITPKNGPGSRVLFLRDDSRPYDFEHNKPVDNVRLPLTSDPRVRSFLDAAAAVQAFLATSRIIDGHIHFDQDDLMPLLLRKAEVTEAVYRHYLKPSDPCTCGSRRQVHQCCGLERACMRVYDDLL